MLKYLKRMDSITFDGKNHGMMMFIDWSGSMADKLTVYYS